MLIMFVWDHAKRKLTLTSYRRISHMQIILHWSHYIHVYDGLGKKHCLRMHSKLTSKSIFSNILLCIEEIITCSPIYTYIHPFVMIHFLVCVHYPRDKDVVCRSFQITIKGSPITTLINLGWKLVTWSINNLLKPVGSHSHIVHASKLTHTQFSWPSHGYLSHASVYAEYNTVFCHLHTIWSSRICLCT